ncbi:MAG: pyruvate formate lyase family protein [Candidatus Methylomirabilales bacterium]
MRDRVARLRQALFAGDDRTVFWERVLALRRAGREHAHEPGGRRYALALQEITASMSVVIREDDLIVGEPREVLLSPEEEARFAAWSPDCVQPPWFHTRGHLTPAWDLLLERGLLGIKQEAEERAAALPPGAPDAAARREFWQATALCCQAVVDLATRYAEAAAALAGAARDEARRAELARIAAVCRRVPARPARAFHEAVQAIWFLDFVLHAVCGARDYSVGRLDQHLLGFYRRDLAAGVLTREDALELLQCLFVKMNAFIGLHDHYTSPVKRSPCVDSVQYLVVGGQRPDGSDATNEVSGLCLEAVDALRLKEPTLTVRYHPGIDRRFWEAVCDAVRRGASIGIYNDEVVIASLQALGVPLEEARGYVHFGCCNPHLPGQEPQLREYQHSLVKCLELALNDGRDPYPARPAALENELRYHSPGYAVEEAYAGPATGGLDSLKTFEDLLQAVKTQITHDVARAVAFKRRFYAEDYLAHRPFCFESALIRDCLARGRDANHGGARHVHHNHYAGGLATVADALVVLKKAVYEEGWLTLAEVRGALAENFAGREALRLRLLHRYPKFGNDDDEVDGIAAAIAEHFCREVLKHRDPVLGDCWPGIYTYHRFKRIGETAGATPDGRLAGTPASENQGPAPGRARRGPAATLRSMAKLPFRLTPAGGQTLTLHPTLFAGPQGAAHLRQMLETYFGLGGLHLQINLVTADTLRAAQCDPDAHRDLVVRVTGYSAYFTTLDRPTQDLLIASASG